MVTEPLLEPEQRQLLEQLVQAARQLPFDEREPFFVARTFGGDSIIHHGLPDGEIDWYFGDVEMLARAGLVSLRQGDMPSFDITPEGFGLIEQRAPAEESPARAEPAGYDLAVPRAASILARRMFAGSTGLGMREVVEFFCGYSDDIPDYPWDIPLSYRAEYFDACLRMLPPDAQLRALHDLCEYAGPARYGHPTAENRAQLLDALTGDATPLDLPTSEGNDWPLVVREWRKALNRLGQDAEASITSARTLLETVCKHICEERGVEYSNDGDVVRLYRLTAHALHLAPEGAEDAMRQLLGGCAGIVSGIAGVRNALGDSHGRNQEYEAPDLRHARLAVNAAGTLATFLIETHRSVPIVEDS